MAIPFFVVIDTKVKFIANGFSFPFNIHIRLNGKQAKQLFVEKDDLITSSITEKQATYLHSSYLCTMKYRLLNAEERKVFDEDFKAFLITNGVHAEEWAEMNKSNVEKAQALVELFSDIVLEKVYEKIEFIEFRAKDSCLVFQCGEKEMQVISIVSKNQDIVDLSTPESIHEALQVKGKYLNVFRSAKAYSQKREMEIHQMVEQGCVASSKDFWIALNACITEEKI